MSLKHLLYHKNMYFTYMHNKYYLCFSFILQLSLFQYFLADLILTFSCVSWFYCCCDPHGTLWRIWFNVFLCFNFVEKELNYVFFNELSKKKNLYQDNLTLTSSRNFNHQYQRIVSLNCLNSKRHAKWVYMFESKHIDIIILPEDYFWYILT